jgi:hypothetical protein
MNKLATLTCCAAIGLSSHTGMALAGDKKPTIEGAWEAVVTLRGDAPDCTTGAIVPEGAGAINPFTAFFTFQQGGTLSEYGNRASPAHRTPGAGVWRAAGKGKPNAGKYAMRYTFLLFDAGNQIQIGRMDVRADVSLATGGNKWTGVSRLVMTDLSGNAF